MLKPFLVAFLEFLLLAVLLTSIRFMALADAETVLAGDSESTLTQYSQEALILLSAILFAICARQRPESRGFLVLVAGFFGCMFIREFNNLLDMIAYGFWVYPVALLAISSIVYARFSSGQVLEPMVEFTRTRSYAYVSMGLLIVIIFSLSLIHI